jgi:hypothetical protein
MEARHIKPDSPLINQWGSSSYVQNWPSLFLAGSIEMGKAEDWQTLVTKEFKDYSINIFNPRRDKWDASLKQDMTNDIFRDQVVWEQKYLDYSKYIIVNIIGNTQSPITLLELGSLCKQPKKKVVVICQKDFWRRGNVEIMCVLNNIPLYENFDDGIAHMKILLSDKI